MTSARELQQAIKVIRTLERSMLGRTTWSLHTGRVACESRVAVISATFLAGQPPLIEVHMNDGQHWTRTPAGWTCGDADPLTDDAMGWLLYTAGARELRRPTTTGS